MAAEFGQRMGGEGGREGWEQCRRVKKDIKTEITSDLSFGLSKKIL